MVRTQVLALSALLALLVAGGQSPARADVNFPGFAAADDDIYLWPVNLHAGYATTFLADGGSEGSVAIGADIAIRSFGRVVIDSLTMRAALRKSTGDLFLGTRFGLAHYLGGMGSSHQVSAGLGAGFGSIGQSFDGETGFHPIVAPGVRYAMGGLLGLEVAAYFPIARGGQDYPMMVSFNLIGSVGLLAMLYR